MKKWLSLEQRGRLTEVVNESISHSSCGELARKLQCSTGILSGISSGNKQGVSVYFSLYLCRGLGVNPYYVTDGLEPKYKRWDVAFMANGSK